ncbi:hypothetical protein ABZY09_35820 [Streptomyces sp. NPDC002928]|uniref:hypothetical protein n=1 Tax=Streptomyces sp. NPDC002928 TaxID=3154440 RepID=UPI0033BE4193
MALRPASMVTTPDLVWHPLPAPAPPRERLAVIAPSGTRADTRLRQVARARGWPLTGTA